MAELVTPTPSRRSIDASSFWSFIGELEGAISDIKTRMLTASSTTDPTSTPMPSDMTLPNTSEIPAPSAETDAAIPDTKQVDVPVDIAPRDLTEEEERAARLADDMGPEKRPLISDSSDGEYDGDSESGSEDGTGEFHESFEDAMQRFDRMYPPKEELPREPYNQTSPRPTVLTGPRSAGQGRANAPPADGRPITRGSDQVPIDPATGLAADSLGPTDTGSTVLKRIQTLRDSRSPRDEEHASEAGAPNHTDASSSRKYTFDQESFVSALLTGFESVLRSFMPTVESTLRSIFTDFLGSGASGTSGLPGSERPETTTGEPEPDGVPPVDERPLSYQPPPKSVSFKVPGEQVPAGDGVPPVFSDTSSAGPGGKAAVVPANPLVPPATSVSEDPLAETLAAEGARPTDAEIRREKPDDPGLDGFKQLRVASGESPGV